METRQFQGLIKTFNERLNVFFDYYHNDGRDLITYDPVTVASGFDYVVDNNGGMKTNGIDLTINGRLINKTVKWDVGLNLSKYKNQVTKVPGGQML